MCATKTADPVGSVIVTGSSGFIGSHLCDQMTEDGAAVDSVHGFDREPARPDTDFVSSQGDIRRRDDLRRLTDVGGRHVVHLAAESRVLFPFSETSQIIDSNVDGTLNVLEVLQPQLLVFASSSAVYGSVGGDLPGVSTDWSNVNPVGIYGISKAMAELVCSEWAHATGGAAVAFRFGNVIGPRCHGFIPYLVEHARRYPSGDVAAQCRGGGKIIRDYLPVRYVTAILEGVFQQTWESGQMRVFNIGTGRGMTNRAVADVVTSVLQSNGLTLKINWDNPKPAAEANSVVLDAKETEDCFGIKAPDMDEIVDAIEESTRFCLDTMPRHD